MTQHIRVAVLSFALASAACAPQETPPEELDQSYVESTRLSQAIGPEGGELVAPDGSALAGLRLQVPPGALSETVTITVDGTIDNTPLGNTAEQVGPQFLIGPAGTRFSVPARLTLPLNGDDVQLHSQTAADCKVWHRTDGAWQRLERVAGDESTVSVELVTAGTAAAGVISRSIGLSCAKNPALCRDFSGVLEALQPRCESPTGYCIVKLRQPQYQPRESRPGFTVSGRTLYYAHSVGDGQVGVATYNLDTGDSELLGTFAGGLSSRPTPVAVEANGNTWLSLGRNGNARFKKNSIPFRADFGPASNGVARDSQGVVVSGGKTVRFFDVGGERFMTDGTSTRPLPSVSPRNGTASLTFRPRPSAPNQIFINSLVSLLTFTFDDTAMTEHFNDSSYGAAAASLVNDGIAAAGTNNNTVRWQTAAGATQRFVVPNSTLMAFDASDRLYAATSEAPELHVLESNGAQAILPLTNAAEGTEAYRRMQPRALVSVPGRNEIIIEVVGNSTPRLREYYLVRQAN